jgi:hypothetical protein
MKKIALLIICLNVLAAFVFCILPIKPALATCTSVFDSSSGCYEQLAPITNPDGSQVSTTNFPTYLQGMYRIGIGACFVLGVIMFTWAGIEYILSESMNTKSDAKKRIAGALTGLAIALVSYILLNTINPDLLKFTNLETAHPTSNP